MVRKKESIIYKIHNNKKKQVLFFVFCMAFLIVGFVLMTRVVNLLKENKIIANKKVVEDYQILYDIEDVNIRDNKMTISGWAMRLGAQNRGIKLIFRDVSGEKKDSILMSTHMYERRDVERVFDLDWNFGNSGFDAEFSLKKIHSERCYEILLVLDYVLNGSATDDDGIDSTKISTGIYLFEEEIYRYNPLDFQEPEISDKELTKVISDGILRACDMENEIWIYQLEDELYVITNPSFGSMKDNNIKVTFMPMTSRSELLPEHRQQYGFDHLGSYFEDQEYARDGITPYQIVRVKLSNKYPNTYISMGLYDVEHQMWKNKFVISLADWSVENFERD